MIFQASEYKGNNFFNLINEKYLPIKPIYTKEGTWLKLFSHFNLLYARATRAITNYTPVGEYYLRFFPKESFDCLCSSYPIKSR